MLLILIIISFFGCIFSQNFIQEPNIIQVGEYTNLICVLNESNYLNSFKKYYFSWFKIDKNNIENLIVDIFNNKIYNNHNPKKFKIFIINNKIILQIKNITTNDKKYKFKCHYFNIYNLKKSYKNIFKNLQDLKFFNPLSSENMKIEYFSNNININFKKIFPIPKCFIKINNESFFPENNIQNKTLDYLYSKVNLGMKINYFNKIKIICNLLNQNFTINSNNNNLIIIISSNLIINFIILFLISEIILIIFIYFKKKIQIKENKYYIL